jgi:hypothetical protein
VTDGVHLSSRQTPQDDASHFCSRSTQFELHNRASKSSNAPDKDNRDAMK